MARVDGQGAMGRARSNGKGAQASSPKGDAWLMPKGVQAACQDARRSRTVRRQGVLSRDYCSGNVVTFLKGQLPSKRVAVVLCGARALRRRLLRWR